MPHLKYLCYLLKYKYNVVKNCFLLNKVGEVKVDIIQMLIHDMSKFSLREWRPYVKAFSEWKKDSTPPNSIHFRTTWKIHAYSNPHHWEFWRGGYIPSHYCKEMVAAWFAAAHLQKKEKISSWYKENNSTFKLHPQSKEYIEKYISCLE